MKFLIDECLSPTLVAGARERGYSQSTHVTWLGLRSKADWTIIRRAIKDGYILVTNDTANFAPLMQREERHPGLVCLNVAHGLMDLDVQRRLFEYALDQLENHVPFNEVLEITLTANRTVRTERYRLAVP